MRPVAVFVVLASLLAGCNTGFLGDRISNPGDAAKELVDPRVHPKLVVEIDFPSGAAPNAEAKALLKSTLAEVTGRDASRIEFVEEGEIPSAPDKKYTINELIALENEHRDRHTSGDTAALYILYVAGGASDDSGDARVLGVTYRGTSIAIMKGNIQASTRSGPLGLPTVDEKCIERSVLVHEFGHAAGLVNLGAPMVHPHEDAGHRGHSSSKDSVMYYAVENSVDLFALFTGGCSDIPYRFDANDKADLAGLRS